MGCTRFLTLLLLLFMLTSCAEFVVYPSNEGKQARGLRGASWRGALTRSACLGDWLHGAVRDMAKFLGLTPSRLIARDSRVKHTHIRALVTVRFRWELVTVLDWEINVKRNDQLCLVKSELGSFQIRRNFGHSGRATSFITVAYYNTYNCAFISNVICLPWLCVVFILL